MSNFQDSRSFILQQLNSDKRESSTLNIHIDDNEIYPVSDKSLADQFKEKFEGLGGSLYEVEDISNVVDTIPTLANEKKINPIVCDTAEIIALFPKETLLFSKEIKDYTTIKATITLCEALIARNGSILVSSRSESGRRLHIIPDVHIVIAYKSQIKLSINDGLDFLKQKYNNGLPSMFSFISGPSRTADIEKTLVMGAHGPKEILLFLINK